MNPLCTRNPTCGYPLNPVNRRVNKVPNDQLVSSVSVVCRFLNARALMSANAEGGWGDCIAWVEL